MMHMKTAGKTPPMEKANSVVQVATDSIISHPAEGLSHREKIEIGLFFIAVFFSCIITTGRMSIIVCLLCFAFSVRKESVEILREHLSLPVVGVICMLLLYGISAMTIQTGAASVLEFFRGVCFISVVGFALLRFRKKHVPELLWGVVTVITVQALISLDGGSVGALYHMATGAINALGGDMTEINPMMNGRLNSLFNNANTSASMLALAMLVSLYHMQTGKQRKTRLAAAFLLGINGVTFWQHVSRGAILCFGISLVVWLLFTRKGERLRLFLILLVSAGSVLVCGILAQKELGSGSILPVMFALLCGPLAFAIGELVTRPILRLLEGREKGLKIVGGLFVVLCVTAIASAFLLSGPYALTGNTPLVRVANLQPGKTYTISGDWDGELGITVYVETNENLLMDGFEYIYTGPLKEAEFTLPTDTAVTRVWISGEGEVRDITFSDGTKLMLDYILLPAAVEDRLQDPLLTSSSFLLRIQYVKDALKIWSEAPIFGRGLASTDTWYTAVQPVYYMSQFAHNHFVQYLANLGILGFAAFLLVAGGSIWLLLRKWKKERSAFAAMMLAVMAMIHLHSLMEINFSIRPYAIMAYLLMGIATIGCADSFYIKDRNTMKLVAVATAVAYWIVLGVFGAVGISYRVVDRMAREYETNSYESYMSMLDNYIRFDGLDDAYYKIVYASEGASDFRYAAKADKYAMELRKTGLFSNCDAVARYYYLPQGLLDEMFACSLEGIKQKAADKDSWNITLDFYRTEVLGGYEEAWASARNTFIEGVLSVRESLAVYSQGRMEEIQLSEENRAFLDAVEVVWKNSNMTDDESYSFLSQFST